MRKYILFFLLLILASCSTNLSDVSKEKLNYVNSAIYCDSRTTDFTILNQEALAGFLASDDHESMSVKYESKKGKREINISKININNSTLYIVSFERTTFPLSECRRIKTESIYFK